MRDDNRTENRKQAAKHDRPSAGQPQYRDNTQKKAQRCNPTKHLPLRADAGKPAFQPVTDERREKHQKKHESDPGKPRQRDFADGNELKRI